MFCQKKDEEVLKLYDEYFAVDEDIRVKERSLDVEFYAFKAMTLYKQKKYQEAFDEFQKYFRLDNKMKKEGICTREALYVARNFTNENAELDLNMCYSEICLKLQKYKEAEENFRKHPENKYT